MDLNRGMAGSLSPPGVDVVGMWDMANVESRWSPSPSSSHVRNSVASVSSVPRASFVNSVSAKMSSRTELARGLLWPHVGALLACSFHSKTNAQLLKLRFGTAA